VQLVIRARCILLCALLSAVLTGCGGREALPRLVLGTTHTLEDSGLLAELEDAFRGDFGNEYQLTSIVAGSGEVLTMARRGDVDVVLAHSPDDEVALVAAGRAETRLAVMHNEFVLLGPPEDTLIAGTGIPVPDALRRIQHAAASFVSRADGSGTHRRELALWATAQAVPDWAGYIDAGAGMADALRVASQRRAYILADRATFEMLRADIRLDILLEDPRLLRNPYSVLVVTDARNHEGARRFAEWIRSPATQQLIAAYGVEQTGRALFVPDAAPPPATSYDRD
jgi:tungstate transport system substrate-binding protein